MSVLSARLRTSFTAVGVPVLACGIALAGLGAWTASGRAGSPPHVAVTKAYVYQSFGSTPETAAFFTLTNDGAPPTGSCTSPRPIRSHRPG